MNIKGTVALVTGANRGLGLAYAQALLAAGASKVYAGARDPSKVTTPGVIPVKLDITDEEQVALAAKQCADVNIVINNAGIALPGGFLADNAVSAARAQFETNYLGTLLMCRAFAPVLRANGGGALVNMLSVLTWVSAPAIGSYCASKAALWSLTNGIRHELKPQGILVVSVHAGYIDTDMAAHAQGSKVKPEDVARQTLEAIERGDVEVLADDISRAVKRGLSNEAGVYLNDPSPTSP